MEAVLYGFFLLDVNYFYKLIILNMPKILKKEFIDDNVLTIECLVESKDYEYFKERITDQALRAVQVKGFRKGKAPREKAMQKINQESLKEIIYREVVERNFVKVREAITKEIENSDRITESIKLNPKDNQETEEGFIFKVLVHFLPKIDLSRLDDLAPKKITADDIDKKLDPQEMKDHETTMIMREFNQYQEVEEPLKEGYRATINFEAEVGGQKLDGLEAKDFTCVIDKKELPPKQGQKFQEQLTDLVMDTITGSKKGQQKTFDITLPSDYDKKDFAGQKATFKVEIVKVAKPTLTDLDQVIQSNPSLKEQFENQAGLYKKIENLCIKKIEDQVEQKKREYVVKRILEILGEFKVNSEVLEREAKKVLQQIKPTSERNGVSPEEAIKYGFPYTKEEDLEASVRRYVEDELKISTISQYIWRSISKEDKPSNQQIEEVVKKAVKNAKEGRIPDIDPKESKERIEAMIFEKIVRNVVADYLIKKLTL